MTIRNETVHDWPQLLLGWFRTHRRDLPWRTTPRDPYKREFDTCNKRKTLRSQ
jgi:A/G-specific adenine glycosylase